MKSVRYSRRRSLACAMSLLLLWSVLAGALPYAAAAAPDASARLAGLSLSAGTLSPVFDPELTAYTANVADNYGELAIVPTAEDAAASITVSINGEDAAAVISGTESPPLALEIGNNIVTVKVVSGDGEEKAAYTIEIAKEAAVLQQGTGYSGQKDVHVSEGTHRDKNTGAHDAVEVGYFDPIMTDRKWGLFQFDMTSIPAEASLTEARLELHLTGTRVRSGERFDKVLNLHEITEDWEEGTGTGFDGTVGAPGVIWDTKPGFNESVLLDSKLVGTAPNVWYSWDLTALAQQWTDGSADNYGVILKEADSASDEATIPSTKDFASAQHGDPTIRPKLVVKYAMPLVGVRLDSEPLALTVGQAPVPLAKAAFARPLNAELTGALQWSSLDETVATVDAEGTVAPVGAGVTEIAVTAVGEGVSFSDTVQVSVTELDTRGVLSGLSVKGADLNPEFLPGVRDYEIEVPLNAREVTVTPEAFEPDSVITISTEAGDSQTVASGSPSVPVKLQTGTTRIQIAVESTATPAPAQPGIYSVTVKQRETGPGDAIIREFLDPNGRVLVVAHRGNWLNGLPENGLDSIRESIDEGVDMVELDIRTTSDGVPVLMHDDRVDRTTNGSGYVSDFTLEQIKQLCLKNSDGTISNPCETIPTLEEAMELARGHIMVNLDIKNADWNTMWDILVRTDTTDHALYKTSAGKASTAEWMAQFKDSAVQPLFMQLTSDPATALDFMNPATTPFTVHAFEISFNDDNAPIVDSDLIAELHGLGARVWVNTIFSVPGLVGRHGDYAFLSDPNAGFPWLLDRGIDMIQTDTTALLLQYLKERADEPSSGVTQTALLQQGLDGYAGAADTHVVELPENNGNRNNFGKNTLVKIGPQHAVLPVMEGNINAKVASVSVTGSSPENEGKDNLLDFSLNTKWLVTQNHAIVAFEMREPVVVRAYALSSANDSPGRDPREWTFEGSNDGDNWFVLDTREEPPFAERFQTKIYRNFANETAYSRYRLNFTANHGDSYLQLAEIQLSDGSANKPQLPASEDNRYGMLRFDLSSIPDGAKLTSAKLALYLVEAGSSGGASSHTVTAHEITEAWEEGNGTGNNGSAVPDGQQWATWDSKPSFNPAPSATASVGRQLYAWKEIDVSGLVKGWLEDPASNYGLLLDGKETSMSFASSDNAVQGWRPKLEVTYTIPAAGIAVAPSELSLEPGEQSRLTATVVPDNVLNRSVSWSSDNETVARVDDTGLVTAIGQGSAVITATTVTGGYTASVPVTVARSQASAFLRELQLSAGELVEAFRPETTAYTASVPEVYNHLAITPLAEEDEADIAISVNGEALAPVAGGQQSEPFPLEIGDNLIVITVTAAGGTAVQTYSITVPKAAIALQEGVDGYTGAADTQLSKGTGGAGTPYYQYNLGAQYGFEVGYYNQTVDDEKYGLVRFDHIPIPAGAVVSEASLHLYHYSQRSADRARDVFVHKANAPWVEGRGGSGDSNDGSPAEPGEATWERYMTNGTNPFAPDVSAQANIDAYPQWYTFEIADIAQDWIESPETNYGVVLKPQSYPDSSDPTMTGTKRFRTKEFTDASLRPYLRIVYSLPASGIALDRTELELALGGSGGKLEAIVKPLNAVDKTVVWSSDNEDVATVDATGHVTAIGIGTATIAAANANGDTAYATVTVRRLGTDAELAGLTLSTGQLSPDFSSDHYAYTAIVHSSVSAIRITPAAADARATIAIRAGDGEPQTVASGSASLPIAVQDGTNIAIEVASEDEQTIRTYTITVVQQAGLSDIRLSTGSLTPEFASDRLQYTVNVPSGTASIRLQPYALDEGETIRISTPDGTEYNVPSGQTSGPIALRSGANIIWLEAAASAVSDSRTYTIVVNRQPAGGGSGSSPSSGESPAAETVKLDDELAVDIPQEEAGLRLALSKLNDTAGIAKAPHDLLSAVYSVEWEAGRRLSKPLILSIAFDSSKLTDGRASVFRLDEVRDEWIEIGGYVQDGVITVATNEAGKFAVYSINGELPAAPEPVDPAPPVATWPDVRNHWAESAIAEAVGKGLLTGYPDGSMKPDNRITRAQFAAMLVRALGLNESLDMSGFTDRSDVPEWAEASMGTAAAAGIISGYPDGTIRPNQPVNRAEMVTMLMRAYRMNGDLTGESGFKDEAAIPEWAKSAVFQAVQLGVVVGNEGEFKPAGAATRAEAIVVILRMMEV